MTLSKPALMSAFLCPGVGQFVAGWRVLGSALVAIAVVSVGAPLMIFLWSLLQAPYCEPYDDGVLGCTWLAVVHAWHVADRPLGIGLLVFALVWVFAVWHANRLSLPDGS